MASLADCLGKVRIDPELRDEVRAAGSVDRVIDSTVANLGDLQEQAGVSPEIITARDLADLAPERQALDPLDRAVLSPEAREWVDGLSSADRSLIADAIQQRPAMHDQRGDLGNLQQALILAKHRALREMQKAAEQVRVVLDQSGIDEATELPLNDDGTVTLYHNTNSARAKSIRSTGVLRSAGEPDVYLTTSRNPIGFGDAVVAVRVDPRLLTLDDEFPDGRRDYRIRVSKPGGSVRVVLDQKPDAIRRGSIIFGGGRFAEIVLTKDADLSTFLHESAHYFLEVWGELAQDPQVDQAFRDDYAKILEWFGVDSRDGIQVEHHEKWARSYEAYLREGKAPSAALRRAFARFRAWLSAVYRTMRIKGAQLNDDIRGVFDRMLATDDEIADAKGLLDGRPLFESAEQAGMTADEFAAYIAAFADADAQAKVVLSRRELREQERETKRWWQEERRKVEGQVRAEVNQTKVYQALAILQKGVLADGSPLPEGQEAFKLDRTALLRDYGEDVVGRLPRRVAKAGGMDPTMAADLLGYGDALALVEALIAAKPKAEVIAAETDLRMRERYGDMALDGRMAEEAVKAIHNPDRGRLLAKEVRALGARVGQGTTPVEVFRDAAERQIEGTKIRDLRPNRYRVAEARAARKAFEAAAKGNWDRAFDEKQRELLNHELYRAATKAQDRADKTVRRLRRLNKKAAQTRLAKSGKRGATYLEQINSLLAAYDLRQLPNKLLDAQRRDMLTGLREFVADLEKQEIPHAIPIEILDAATPTNWRELTVDQFAALRDAIASLEHLAKGESDLILADQRRNLEEVTGAVAGAILEAGKGGAVNPVFSEKSARKTLSDAGAQLAGLILNPDTLIRADLDGGKENGPAHTHLKQVLDNAIRERLVPGMAKAGEDVDRLQSVYTKQELAAMRKRAVRIDELGETVTKWEIIALALNWGNEGNREAVIGSAIFNQKGGDLFTIQRILDKHMDKKDWGFVQSVWDYIDSYWPQIAAAQKRRTGVVPKKIQAMPVFTPHGTYRGGYFPLIYDRSKSTRATAHELEEMAKGVRSGQYVTASTRRGHTKERVGSGGLPILYDAGNIHRHLAQVIRDLTMGDEVRYVARVLAHPTVADAFSATGKAGLHQTLELWLSDVASGEMVHSDFWSRRFRWVRTGFAVSKMAYNLKVAALQLTGFTQTAVVIGKRNTLLGLKDLMTMPWRGSNSAWKQITDASPFMAKRAETFQKDLIDARKAVKGSGWRETITRWGFVPIQRMQLLVDMGTWLGGRRKAQQLGLDGIEATRYADSIVARSQASGIFADRSAVERGTLGNNVRQVEFVRMMTTLKSYLLLKLSIAYERTRDTQFSNPLSALRWASDMLLLFTFEGMLTFAILELASDDPDDDEDRLARMAAAAGRETASSLLGGIPLVGQAVSAIEGFSGGNADVEFAQAVGRAWEQVKQGEIDRAGVKAMVVAGGMLFHLPTTQPNRVLDAIWRDAEGEDVAPIEYLIGRPPKR